MNHFGHKATQQALFEGVEAKEVPVGSGITAENMVTNYGIISAFFDKELAEKHKFETFVFYFLHRLVLINLSVEQTDVSMVFEVINDRGVRLRPYEILKGKLLGQIDKIELDRDDYNGLWETGPADQCFQGGRAGFVFSLLSKGEICSNAKRRSEIRWGLPSRDVHRRDGR